MVKKLLRVLRNSLAVFLLLVGTASAENELKTYLNLNCLTAPAVSAASEARVICDSASNTLKVSESAGVYTTLAKISNLVANSFVYLGTGSSLTATTAPTNGQLLIGSTGVAPVVAGLTGTANQITVTAGAGSITLSTPQDIHTAASPTFTGVTTTGGVAKLNLGSVASRFVEVDGTGNPQGIELDTTSANAGPRILRFSRLGASRFDFGYDGSLDTFIISDGAIIRLASNRNGNTHIRSNSASTHASPDNNITLKVESSLSTVDPLAVFGTGGELFRVKNDGNISILSGSGLRPSADSTTALKIQNAAGTTFITFDTTNSRTRFGSSGLPQSTVHVTDGSYFQAEDNNAGAPLSTDCDAASEIGRQSLDTTNNRLYICMGATRGWDFAALTD